MYLTVVLLFIVAVCGAAPKENTYYKTQIGQKTGDAKVDKDGYLPLVRYPDLPYFSSGRHMQPTETDDRQNIFIRPVHFTSTFNGDGSKNNEHKILKYSNPKLEESSVNETREEFQADKNGNFPSGERTFRHSFKPLKGKNHGKSSYPATKGSRRRADPAAMKYYTDLYSKQDDVEMILPKEKAIILPMVNGKPKPYQGYRAASDVVNYQFDDGDVIYGKPKKGVESIGYERIKRSPAEYHGAIYPHFDYSDPENAARIAKDRKDEISDKKFKNKKGYPKKHTYDQGKKPYDYYKYPKGMKRTNKRSSESEENAEEEEGEDSEEEEDQVSTYKYKYDSTFTIPELEIKYYPYEKQKNKNHKDGKGAGTEDEETHESQIDEYTAGYERYKKTLPHDLESYFGKPDFGDYSVEATENLEENKNCQRIERGDRASENSTEDSGKGTEICYICIDPKTGGNYERCAYKSSPKNEKYFYGGSTSSRSDESPETVKYRYKRSTFGEGFDLDSFIFDKDHSGKRKVRHNVEDSYYNRPRQKSRRNKKNRESEERHPPSGSYNNQDHYGSPSSKKNKKSKNKEGPPSSYDGPKYTYEGPKHTYEGPAEPYEGPINKEYYIKTDDRIENDETSQSNDESKSRPQKEYYDYNMYHPSYRNYGQSTNRNKYYSGSEADDEETEESFKPGNGYRADYRFGPEHFVDDGNVEEERPKERQRSESNSKPVDKKQKNSGSEPRPASSIEAESKESDGVKVFKNGDVCRKKKVDGMICMVCKNEKTAATYEQCQYSSKPKDKYYAFGSQKSYRTTDPNAERNRKNEEEDQHPEKSDIIEKKILITKQSKVFQDNSGPLDNLPDGASFHEDLLGAHSDHLETHIYGPDNKDTQDRQVSVSRMEPRDGIEGLEEYLYSDNEKKATGEDGEYQSYDEYFHDIFPEFSNRKENEESAEVEEEEDDEVEESEESEETERRDNFDPFSNIKKFKDDSPAFLEEYSVDDDGEESSRSAEATNEEPLRLKDKKSRLPPDFFSEDREEYHKKDIEKALGEFQNRDWSNCKKIVKSKLTCYQCVDKNGVNNEECMYVEASQPMKKHLAYHEKKELKPERAEVGKETEIITETEVLPTENPKASKRTRRPKNAKEEIDGGKSEQMKDSGNGKGDFEGTGRVIEEDIMTPVPSVPTEAIAEDPTESPQAGGDKWNPKRIKTSKKPVESTTEIIRKRRLHPFKKLNQEIPNDAEESERVATARALYAVTTDVTRVE